MSFQPRPRLYVFLALLSLCLFPAAFRFQAYDLVRPEILLGVLALALALSCLAVLDVRVRRWDGWGRYIGAAVLGPVQFVALGLLVIGAVRYNNMLRERNRYCATYITAQAQQIEEDRRQDLYVEKWVEACRSPWFRAGLVSLPSNDSDFILF